MDHEELLHKALNLSYFYLKFRPRSKHEMGVYLRKKGFEESVIAEAISMLEMQKFVNDDAFVGWYVTSRGSAKPRSRYVLERELSRFGIDKQIIEIHFADEPVDEEELAYKALSVRWRRYASLEPDDRFKKAAAFLSRRGFSYDLIKKTIAKCEETG